MSESRVANFVLILMVASLVALLVKVVPIPYVSALAIVGAVAGAVWGSGSAGFAVHLTPSLILFDPGPGRDDRTADPPAAGPGYAGARRALGGA